MNKWQQYKEKLGTTRPWDVLNPNTEFSEEELFNKRINTCFDCDRLIKVTAQCKECGCFMKMKARLKEAKCPLGKW
ncbi:MAG: hypothetical protein RI887_710 [Actinomycetota bacterium]|jgi:hypothetical protein